MTPDEFIRLSVQWHGSALGWQAALARALDVEPRSIRRFAQHGPPEGVARDLRSMLGERAPQGVHARFVLGFGEDGREYIHHSKAPRFTAMVVPIDPATDEPQTEYGIDQDDGVQYRAGTDLICALHWIDRMPDDPVTISRLMDDAADAITRISEIVSAEQES